MQRTMDRINTQDTNRTASARLWRRALAILAALTVVGSASAQPADSIPSKAPSGKQSAASKSKTRRASRAKGTRSSRSRAARAARNRASASYMANFAALKGSRPKVQGTFYSTVNRGVTFYDDMAGARAAIAAGKFVPLYGNLYYATYHMTLAYATPQAKAFIEAFAPQFVEHCDEMMVVTSALRPREKSPRNGSPWTVHPTGIAVDIRKPRNQQCMAWVRKALLDYQSQGFVDATEEFHPPHFHVAVIKAPPAPTRVVTTSGGEVIAVVR